MPKINPKRVLLIHHLESMWDEPLERITGKDSIDIGFDLVRALKKRKPFDRIILTQFENFKPEEGHFQNGLADIVDEWHDYAYGWDLNDMDIPKKDRKDYVEGGRHSPNVWVPPWVRALKGSLVTLCGAFDGECIEDMEIALEAAEVKFNRWEKFIVSEY